MSLKENIWCKSMVSIYYFCYSVALNATPMIYAICTGFTIEYY
jgi:hypothetical protein